MELPQNNPSWEGLKIRAASAAALALLVLVFVILGGILFPCLVILAALLLMKEWTALTENQSPMLKLMGYPYIIIPCASLIWLRNLSLPMDGNSLGLTLVIAFIAVISATDIGAYFTGKKFGQHKLAPAISPNKTWEGLGGGVLAAVMTGIISSPYIHAPHSFFSVIFFSIVIALFAQGGDLFQSWVKRLAGVKDSGTIIPGHGGLLDRVDGYMFTAPLFSFIVSIALAH